MRVVQSKPGLFLIAAVFFTMSFISEKAMGSFDGPMGPWENQDIGATGIAGSAINSNGTFVVRGAGEDHWSGTADASHYMYRSWTGDGAFIIRVSQFTNSNSGPKAGIMFRATLDPAAKNVFVMLRPGGVTGVQYRYETGGQSAGKPGIYANAPYWLKLVRSENTFLSYDSVDGLQWRLIDLVDIDMPQTIFVGLAVNSNQYGSLRTALFDNLQISSLVPKPPSGLIAVGGLSSVSVTWIDNSTNEEGFVVEWSYSGTSFFPYSQFVGANVTNFTVETWLYPTTISFRVKARNLHESAYSQIATGTGGIIGPLPVPWQSSDIGPVRETGSGDYLGGIFRISGAGTDIGGVADQFHYAFQPLTGDGEIVAFFEDSLGYIGPGPSSTLMKSGLMFRQSLAPDSANAFIFVTPESGAETQMRTNAGGTTTLIPTSEWRFPGIWLRLTRSNNTFTAFLAGTNLDWVQIASGHIEMTDTILAGMAVTSHSESVLQSAAFWNVRVAPKGGRIEAARNKNVIELRVNGMMGRSYGIDGSTNLVNWTRLVTQTNTVGIISFNDIEAQNYHQRFYRSVLVE